MTIASPSIPGTENIVSPYGADIDPSVAGTVQYTSFNSHSSHLSTVSSFVRSETGNYNFYGNTMMIAEWNSVSKFGRSSVS